MRDLRRRALIAACVLGALGCDEGGGRVGRLHFEVAAYSEDGCTAENESRSTVAEQTPCTVLRVYRRDSDGRLSAIPLVRPGQHDETAQGSLELRFSDRNIAFDAMLPLDEASHDIFLTVYSGRPWLPTYGAYLEGVRLDQGDIRVRLHPLRAWSCPGKAGQNAHPEPRAFHAAVTVGNGHVLLLGGVTGTRIDPAGATRTGEGRVNALLQSIPEVYDPVEHRFRRLTMVGGARGFARVLFDAVYLGQDSSGRYRVRAIGGYELPEAHAGAAVLGFDSTGVLAPHGAPFAPTPEAEAAPVVDLLYDAEAGTLEIVRPDPDPLGVRGAAVSISEPNEEGARAMLIGMTGTGAGQEPSSNYYVIPASDEAYASRSLHHQRLGATPVPLPALGGGFLVWGGNVSREMPRVLSHAGEILGGENEGTILAADELSLPRPTAFHTATRLGSDGVLIIGGVSIEEIEDDGSRVLTGVPEDPIFALRVAEDGTVRREDVLDGDYTPTLFHTATDFPGWGVVVVGGAEIVPGRLDRLMPVRTVGRVARNEAGVLEYDGELQDLARPRFGHAATLLPGHRLLVTGGFDRVASGADAGLTALSLAEVIYLAKEPYPSIEDGACNDQSTLPDAGFVDAGYFDAGRADGGSSVDAATPDDAGPMTDAAMADGGM